MSLGVINGGILTYNSMTALTPQSVTGNVTCASETLAAISFVDNRVSSVSPEMVSPANSFGLGFDDAQNPIGGYTISINNGSFNTNNNNAYVMRSVDNGATWVRNQTQQILNAIFTSADASLSNTTPRPFSLLNFSFSLAPYISKRSSLDMSHEIDLDGSATLMVTYL